MRIDLDGKRALVLGASGGLGGAIARGLSQAGAVVAVSGRSAEKLRAAFPDPSRNPIVAADLGRPDAGARLAEQALTALGAIDILVNNSGGPPPSTALGTDADAWKAQFEAMVLSLITLTGQLLPAMRARRWGRVMTVASAGVVAPIPNLAVSNALRSALLGWSKTLASEVAPDGVTVNMLLPGRIATARVEALDRSAAERTNTPLSGIEAAARATIPVGRYGTPEEFGAVAVFLASPQASYVTGSAIRVDGGLLRNV